MSASELYRQSGRRQSAKLVPTFAGRGKSGLVQLKYNCIDNLRTMYLSAVNMPVTHVLLHMTAYPQHFMVSDQMSCTSFIIFSSTTFIS
jgi:hypothetical protein